MRVTTKHSHSAADTAAISQGRAHGRRLRSHDLLATVVVMLFTLLSGAGHAALPAASDDMSTWFEAFKREASDEELYRFLYAMPKGGDLHNHLSGSIRSEWFFELALAQQKNGYRYYTRVKINNCRPYGSNAFSETPYLMLFVNVQESNYEALSTCEKEEYLPLDELNAEEKEAWLDSLRLDKAHEGRDEFFQTR